MQKKKESVCLKKIQGKETDTFIKLSAQDPDNCQPPVTGKETPHNRHLLRLCPATLNATAQSLCSLCSYYAPYDLNAPNQASGRPGRNATVPTSFYPNIHFKV